MILLKLAHSWFGDIGDLDSVQNIENRNNNHAQVFLARLLALFFTGQLCFCLLVSSVD